MAELTSKRRNALPDSAFGMPGERKYPVQDDSHAKNAKARASQQYKRGNITREERDSINRKANRRLEK